MNTQNKKQFEPVKLNFSKETVMILNNIITSDSNITKPTESCQYCASADGNTCETLWFSLIKC